MQPTYNAAGVRQGLHTFLYCLPVIRLCVIHLYIRTGGAIGEYSMHPISKTLLGSLFILSPLSAAMADEAVQQFPVIKNTVANLVEQDSQKTLAAVTVIDREEIERKQFNSLQDLLRTVPSISIKNNGGLGKVTGVSIRGTESRHVLVLVDGQKVGSATLGETAFEHFPIDQIERVEVLRGPRSSLYGSEAIGGVIQIFTRKESQDGVKPFVSLGYGSHETYDANIGFNVKQGGSWAALSVAGTKTQGFDATAKTAESDKDGYENASVSLKAGHQFNDKVAVDANILHINADNEYDSGLNAHSKIQQNVYGAGLTYQPTDSWKTQVKAGRTEDKLDSRDGYPSVINTQRDSISWLNTLTFAENQTAMLGVDYQNDQVGGNKKYAVKERDNKGYFAQYLGGFGRFDVQGAVRFDDNEQFGNHTTGSVTLGYDILDKVQTYISYGTAFKAPTFNDLYWPYSEDGPYPNFINPALSDIYITHGTDNLIPEESENYEIGFKGQISALNWELNGFYNIIDNLIAWGGDSLSNGNVTTYYTYPVNINKARIRGGELSLGQNYENWVWSLNYTYQDPENRTQGSNSGKQIIYKAKQLFNLSADYTMDKWTVGGSVHAEDKRYLDDANVKSLSGFTTADTRVTYQATPEFSIQAKLANMFDKQYQTVNGYNQDGRTAWVTLRYAMK